MLNFLGKCEVNDATLLSWGASPSNRDEYEALMRSMGLSFTWHDLRDGLPELRKDTLYVLTGGKDIHPSRWGDEVLFPELEKVEPERDEAEFNFLSKAVEAQVPILGICRGIQVINVFFGGTLFHDIATELSGVITLCDAHLRITELSVEGRRKLAHMIYFAKGLSEPELELLRLLKAKHKGYVTSRHHQAIRKLGDGLKIVAFSKDGIVEAIIHESLPLVGVQWHPESPLPEKYKRLMELQERRDIMEREMEREWRDESHGAS